MAEDQGAPALRQFPSMPDHAEAEIMYHARMLVTAIDVSSSDGEGYMEIAGVVRLTDPDGKMSRFLLPSSTGEGEQERIRIRAERHRQV